MVDGSDENPSDRTRGGEWIKKALSQCYHDQVDGQILSGGVSFPEQWERMLVEGLRYAKLLIVDFKLAIEDDQKIPILDFVKINQGDLSKRDSVVKDHQMVKTTLKNAAKAVVEPIVSSGVSNLVTSLPIPSFEVPSPPAPPYESPQDMGNLGNVD